MMPEKEIRKMAYALQDKVMDIDREIEKYNDHIAKWPDLKYNALVERHRLEVMKEKAMAAQEALWTVLEWKE